MSTLDQFLGGGGVKSVQTGFVRTASTSSGHTEEDVRYIDISISAVNVAKSIVLFDGASGSTVEEAYMAFRHEGTNVSTHRTGYRTTARLTSSTNLRLSGPSQYSTAIFGRWTVVEFA